MGTDQYPELLRSQTLREIKYHTPQSRSVIKMSEHQVQYFLMLWRRLANILEHQGQFLQRATALCLLECVTGEIYLYSGARLCPVERLCGKPGLRIPQPHLVGSHTLEFCHKVLEQWVHNPSTIH